ncbi:DUF2231 domain-containing protein [Halomonas dongshanensis]|uniref:DUF2231 domain-containing protein n=1 Tax=Halomonas dongshanensis TaxID=2890835 RepID=A0ABT2EAD5_9GAMM|nr:hypothetical protein [Halomonas dongshanensis]
MTAVTERTYRSGLNPLHAILLAGAFPLYLGAALSDYAYATSYHIQWSTFASWLIAGGLVFNGLALIAALVGLIRPVGSRGRALVYFLVLLVTWIVGFIGALFHAQDAWAMMPTGFVLSIVVTLLALLALILGFSRFRLGGSA